MMADDDKYRDKMRGLLDRHIAYFDHMTWPKDDTQEFTDVLDTWCEAFGEKRYSPGVVARACLAIRKKPPAWKQDHLPELLRLIEESQAEAAGRTSEVNPPADPDAPPCPHCEGSGFTRAYRSDYAGTDSERVTDPESGTSRIVYYAITGPCVCRQGRRIWANWLENKVKSQDLAALPRGWHLEGENRVAYDARSRSEAPY